MSVEILFLFIYWLFSYAYVMNTIDANKSETIWSYAWAVIISMLIGPFLFPLIFGDDVYKKLNDK